MNTENLTGSRRDKEAFELFVKRILDAKRSREKANLSIYTLCHDFELSGSWKIYGSSFELLLRQELGINVPMYVGYRSAVAMLKVEGVYDVGLAGAREIVRLSAAVEDKKLTTDLFNRSLTRIRVFKAKKKMAPSGRYAIQIVREEAEYLGIPVNDDHVSFKDKYHKTLAALQQIVDLGCSDAGCPGQLIAMATLKSLGIPFKTVKKAA